MEHVILLHGLCRTPRSMRPLEGALGAEGYTVWNVGYASRTAAIEALSDAAIGPALGACEKAGGGPVHFVTHSLGGILVRSYLSRHAIERLGRIVMLGPPNRGSEVVDRLKGWWLFQRLNGPSGSELGTELTSTPNRLPPVDANVGVIAGTRSLNWINSLMISGPNDGKVSVERTKADGLAHHLALPTTHPFMMRNPEVIRQVIAFLEDRGVCAIVRTHARGCLVVAAVADRGRMPRHPRPASARPATPEPSLAGA